MYCQNFSHQRAVLFDGLDAANLEILKMSETEVVPVSLFGSKRLTGDLNCSIIKSSIKKAKNNVSTTLQFNLDFV